MHLYDIFPNQVCSAWFRDILATQDKMSIFLDLFNYSKDTIFPILVKGRLEIKSREISCHLFLWQLYILQFPFRHGVITTLLLTRLTTL